MVFSSTAPGLVASRTPYPLSKIALPSLMTATAAPGTWYSFNARVMNASRSAAGSFAAAAMREHPHTSNTAVSRLTNEFWRRSFILLSCVFHGRSSNVQHPSSKETLVLKIQPIAASHSVIGVSSEFEAWDLELPSHNPTGCLASKPLGGR
jgi:hypothetical protein